MKQIRVRKGRPPGRSASRADILDYIYREDEVEVPPEEPAHLNFETFDIFGGSTVTADLRQIAGAAGVSVARLREVLEM